MDWKVITIVHLMEIKALHVFADPGAAFGVGQTNVWGLGQIP